MDLNQTTKWVETICEAINMPQQAAEKILQVLPQVAEFEEEINGMNQRQLSENAWKSLKERLEPDPDGWKILSAMLVGAQQAAEDMKQAGNTPQQIWDTMGAFSRFVKEHFAELGRYGFDRDFWTWRQLCGQIVRLGCFEYEVTDYLGTDWKGIAKGAPCVLIHIPGDSCMTPAEQQQSIAQARSRWGKVPFLCFSWLMAPALEELLPPKSNLKVFRSQFQVFQTDLENKDYIRWVFNNTTACPEQWPEDTTLQRNIKGHILGGGTIGAAWGYLMPSL